MMSSMQHILHAWSSYNKIDTVFPYMFIYWAFNNKIWAVFEKKNGTKTLPTDD